MSTKRYEESRSHFLNPLEFLENPVGLPFIFLCATNQAKTLTLDETSNYQIKLAKADLLFVLLGLLGLALFLLKILSKAECTSQLGKS